MRAVWAVALAVATMLACGGPVAEEEVPPLSEVMDPEPPVEEGDVGVGVPPGTPRALDPWATTAALFPGSRVDAVHDRDGNLREVVLGVRRGGKQGMVRQAEALPVDGGWVLGFELWLAEPGVDVVAYADGALPAGKGPEQPVVVTGVVLVDESGGFVAKPPGYPIEVSLAESGVDPDQMDEFASYPARDGLVELREVEGSSTAVAAVLYPDGPDISPWPRFMGRSFSVLQVFEARQGELYSSEPHALGRYESPDGVVCGCTLHVADLYVERGAVWGIRVLADCREPRGEGCPPEGRVQLLALRGE